MIALLLSFFACDAGPEPQELAAPSAVVQPIFVRDGQIVPGAGGQLLPGGRSLQPLSWTPNSMVNGQPTPLQAECVPLFSVELEDQSHLASLGAPTPDTALAFSPDGQKLAIGSFGGNLLVVDGWSGEVLVKKKVAEGMVKQLAWSADGATLYVGEQSPDAMLSALDPQSLAPRWSVSLASDLGTSPLPPAEDVYGPYSLPGVYKLIVLEDQSLLVVGTHGWAPTPESRQNRSRIWRFNKAGEIVASWPPASTADAILLHPVVFGQYLLASVSRSATGPEPAGLPIGGVALFNLEDLRMRWGQRFDPLKPYFSSVFVWEALGLSDHAAMVGLGDGRAFLLSLQGEILKTLSPGVPVLSQGIPIATGVGFGALYGDTTYLLTTNTNIPYGSADPATRPPSAHPAQNTVHAFGSDGQVLWHRQLEHVLAGLDVSPDGQELLTTAGERVTDQRHDLFGAVVLDRQTGEIRSVCSTEGPAWFRPAYGPDGRRFAIAESSFLKDGAVSGRYQVTVFR